MEKHPWIYISMLFTKKLCLRRCLWLLVIEERTGICLFTYCEQGRAEGQRGKFNVCFRNRFVLKNF